MKKIKLVLADGNRLFVESLQQILEKEMDTAVISGANSGVDALRSCIEIQPDIAVVGEPLPDLSMVEAVLHALQPLVILVLVVVRAPVVVTGFTNGLADEFGLLALVHLLLLVVS